MSTQTRLNEAKFEFEIHISYQISDAFIVISILSQPRLNETDVETICCILDEEFIRKKKELEGLGWSSYYQIDVTKRKIIDCYQTDFSYSYSSMKFWGFSHHKNILVLVVRSKNESRKRFRERKEFV